MWLMGTPGQLHECVGLSASLVLGTPGRRCGCGMLPFGGQVMDELSSGHVIHSWFRLAANRKENTPGQGELMSAAGSLQHDGGP